MASKRSDNKVHQIPVSQIIPGNNDRTVFDPARLQELANSIREHGLAQPITVRPVAGRQQYEIIAGERRFRAISEYLKMETAPCLVRELDDEEASAIMLAENTGRVDLDPISEATAYASRQEKYGWDARKIAEVAGVSVDRVNKRLQLLKLVPEIQHFIKTGAMPQGHALLLVDLDNNRQRIALRIFNAAKSMPLTRFQEITSELHSQQVAESQLSLFESFWLEQVESETYTRRGKKARTGAPINPRLPAVKVTGKDNAGDIMDRYIGALLEQGHSEAAAAIGTIYNALVAGNWVQVPVNSVLAKTAEEGQTAGSAAVEKL